MRVISVILLTLLASTNAQFHEVDALKKQEVALVAEEVAIVAAIAVVEEEMNVAVEVMEEEEAAAEYQEALEKGEANAPDGTPIPGNQNNGVRPLDPRTPVSFGSAFARVNDIEEEITAAVLESGLSSSELALIAELQAQEGNSTIKYMDEWDTMFVIHVPPRDICGVNLEHAENTCGPSCNPDYPCTMGHVDFPNFVNFISPQNVYQNWGWCHKDALCSIVDDHTLILDDNNACKTRKITNPCPNPCDCFRNQSQKDICKQTCARTDSMSIAACQIKRKSGKRRREKKIASALDDTKACAFNVFYEHPLMHSEGLEKEALPGLFGTF